MMKIVFPFILQRINVNRLNVNVECEQVECEQFVKLALTS